MHKSDRTAAGCTVEDEPYKLLERDAEKSILAGPLRFPPGQLPFSTSLKAPVPFTHDAMTVPVMFGPNITGAIKPFNVACDDFTASGALSGGKSSTPWNGKTNVGSSVITDIALAASKYDAKYGASSTVQPTSLRLVHCIKS